MSGFCLPPDVLFAGQHCGRIGVPCMSYVLKLQKHSGSCHAAILITEHLAVFGCVLSVLVQRHHSSVPPEGCYACRQRLSAWSFMPGTKLRRRQSSLRQLRADRRWARQLYMFRRAHSSQRILLLIRQVLLCGADSFLHQRTKVSLLKHRLCCTQSAGVTLSTCSGTLSAHISWQERATATTFLSVARVRHVDAIAVQPLVCKLQVN